VAVYRIGRAGSLLTLRHYHEVARRLDIQLFALFVADDRFLFPALLTHALLAQVFRSFGMLGEDRFDVRLKTSPPKPLRAAS
jgi:hypothetical protein